ncbi:MAG: GTPase Era [Gammaproteobacteria bacterium]|nr:GTPase Era [Gammaproteobacteria bacterium]
MSKKVGFVAIVGRPNVGKSTLMNKVLGQKVSITSRRPQTTRHRILGIHTTATAQIIFVDTPGLHKGGKKAINQFMNRQASQSIGNVDAVVFVVEGTRWTDEDDMVAAKLQNLDVPLFIAVNKVDLIDNKEKLLPALASIQSKVPTAKDIIPVSAAKGSNLDRFEKMIEECLPESDTFYPEDQITDKTDRFLTAEVIREKLMRSLGQELPYVCTVEIEQFKEDKQLLEIAAVIWVERDGQKAIIIGKQGQKLKEIGTAARKELEVMFGQKVFLQLWVRVKSGWTDDIRALQSLGYRDNE